MSLNEILQYTDSSVLHAIKPYSNTQLGSYIRPIASSEDDLDDLDIILIGCGEVRGQQADAKEMSLASDLIRKELYQLHFWHPEIKIGDLGNIIQGKSLKDTKSALSFVLGVLNRMNKRVLILGGSHDLTIQQYEVFKQKKEMVDFTVIDMLVDLNDDTETEYNSFLLEALTSSPNYVRHFNLIGFQSYYANPHLIETLDKLQFDCFRLGKAREYIDQLEPNIRATHLLSIDINCVKYSDAPANKFASPNGFFGDEICKLARYAGMSQHLMSMGIYGYLPENDQEQLTARLISQMIWYYFDGLRIQKSEADLNDTEHFLNYHVRCMDTNILFMKSQKTNRWWMSLPDGSMIPCTHFDYQIACTDELPERWLREMERLV